MSIAFIDLQKAFDTINRDLLLGVLDKLGCPSTFASLLWALYTDTRGAVLSGSDTSEPSAGTVGVKQWCVLAPSLFDIYLVAIFMLASRAGTRAHTGGVPLRYRFDCGLM